MAESKPNQKRTKDPLHAEFSRAIPTPSRAATASAGSPWRGSGGGQGGGPQAAAAAAEPRGGLTEVFNAAAGDPTRHVPLKHPTNREIIDRLQKKLDSPGMKLDFTPPGTLSGSNQSPARQKILKQIKSLQKYMAHRAAQKAGTSPEDSRPRVAMSTEFNRAAGHRPKP